MVRFSSYSWVVILVTLISCSATQSSKESETYHFSEDSSWSIYDTLDFSFDIVDTSQIWSLSLNMNITKDYGYENIYFNLISISPDNQAQTKLLSLDLIDKNGFWKGRCKRQECALKLELPQSIVFDQSGVYTYRLVHQMRADLVPHIHSIQLSLTT